MADLINLYSESGRNIIGDDTTPALTLENSSTGNAFLAKTGSSGSATVASVKVSASVASAPAFEFAGSVVVSTASVSGATLNAAVRVKFGNVYGWIPVYNSIQ